MRIYTSAGKTSLIFCAANTPAVDYIPSNFFALGGFANFCVFSTHLFLLISKLRLIHAPFLFPCLFFYVNKRIPLPQKASHHRLQSLST